ncbi:LacI family DNA-binding transcriptional regulator [Pedobacter chitinilyticus]|uniref:LacI family transcriptional regulator n=1 Tax=Pedobacter chitinilyticus TaxID=2233776 RepID=A0A3S3PM37_9SPHI|nr:LacI family DNA-binding transcriptional regulator [Pedobacter chitinilyticus]RWU03981.1 LacI family transcriptional regulator [Pedobacter chitinilyticus]
MSGQKKKTTIYDIAKELNITVSTVSRALSGFPAISDTTRQAVIETAKRLNYSPNKLASALKSGQTHIIGVIVPSLQAHFFASIIHSIEKGLKGSGYRVILYQSNESLISEINGVKTLLEAQVDGIMASLSLETDNVDHFSEVIKQNKPLILFDRVHEKLDVPKVILDDFKAGYTATQHLIDQGYKNIAYLTTIHQIPIFSERLKGYKAALADNDLPLNEENIIFGGLSIKDGRFGVGKLMRLEHKPDAIIAADDFTALGAIKKLKEIDQVPPKIGVIGFANEAFSAYITPTLSTIDQHPNQMGTECVKLFLDMIKDKSAHNTSTVIIEPSLMERQSTLS